MSQLNANSAAPAWEAFLSEIFNGDKVLIAQAQRLFGAGVL